MQNKYNEEYYLTYGDPRTADWPLMDNPFKVVAIGIVYLVMAIVVGPQLMLNRSPFKLKKLMIIYNSGITFLNGWIFYVFIKAAWFRRGMGFSIQCEPVDLSFKSNEEMLKLLKVGWIFFFAKHLQYIETVFYVLRKKHSQMNAYHLPHHFLTPLVSWYGFKYAPRGYTVGLVLINSFVLTWTYLYRVLKALEPTVRKRPWWKKYLNYMRWTLYISGFLYTVMLYFFPPKQCKVSFFLLRLEFFGFFLFVCLRHYIKINRKKAHIQEVGGKENGFSNSNNKMKTLKSSKGNLYRNE